MAKTLCPEVVFVMAKVEINDYIKQIIQSKIELRKWHINRAKSEEEEIRALCKAFNLTVVLDQ